MHHAIPPELDVEVEARKFALSDAALARADAAIVVLDRDSGLERAVGGLPQSGLWKKLLQAQRDAGQETPVLAGRLPNRRHTLVVVGFARSGASGFERLQLAGKLVQAALQPGVVRLQLHAGEFAGGSARLDLLEALLSAALAHAAPMPEHKTRPTPRCPLARIDIAHAASPAFTRSVAVAAGNHLARWLAALPPNVLDSAGYRAALHELAQREGWTFRFHGVDELGKLGAGAFLAVARANSHRDAGIVRLTWQPPGTRKGRRRVDGIALVGKGICFDTGGVNLKAHRGMYTMHGDMQGSSVAVGTLLALSRLGAPYPVDCWLALTENQIGPDAFRPQEVVRACNGVTIQVVHSDAEGRMVLADTLALASREKPRFMLDFATLTGACVNALTERYAGAFTNRESLHDWLQQAGRQSGERVWCFPLDEDFDSDLESKVADVMQCTLDSKGDHILAARFLGRFVDPAVPWVHVDLAPSERKGGLAHVPTEFTGFGVRYAVHLLDDAGQLEQQLQAAS
jgi:leucyl aminopeptidase